MTREAQHQLYQALNAHKIELEIIRGGASGPDLEALDRRIEAARLLLEWISPALEPDPPASPEVQTPPPSSAPADPDQIPPPDSPKTSRRWSAFGRNIPIDLQQYNEFLCCFIANFFAALIHLRADEARRRAVGRLASHLFGDFKEQPAEGGEAERDRHLGATPDGDRRQPKRETQAGGGAWRVGGCASASDTEPSRNAFHISGHWSAKPRHLTRTNVRSQRSKAGTASAGERTRAPRASIQWKGGDSLELLCIV
jgi:hypothetical protein